MLLFQMAQTKMGINTTVISTGIELGEGHKPRAVAAEVACPEKPATSSIKGSSFHAPCEKKQKAPPTS